MGRVSGVAPSVVALPTDVSDLTFENAVDWKTIGDRSFLLLKRFNGSAGAKTAVLNTQYLGGVGFGGYGTTGYPNGGVNSALLARARNTFTDALAGTELSFWATLEGDDTATEAAVLDADYGWVLPDGTLDGYSLIGGQQRASALVLRNSFTHTTESGGVVTATAANQPQISSATAFLIARDHIWGLPDGATGSDGLTAYTSAFIGPRAFGIQIENSYRSALNTRALSTAMAVQDQSGYASLADTDGGSFAYTGGVVSGANVTFTVSSGHPIPVGASIVVTGSANALFDGTYTVTVTGLTTVTALKGTAVGTSASGNIGVSVTRGGMGFSFCAVPQGFSIGGVHTVSPFGTELGMNERFSDNPQLWCIDGGTWDFHAREGLIGFRSWPYLTNANAGASSADMVVPIRRAIWINRVTTLNNNALLGSDEGIRIDYLDSNALVSLGISNGSRYAAPNRTRELTSGTGNGVTATVRVFTGHQLEVGDHLIIFGCDNDDFEGTVTVTAVNTTNDGDFSYLSTANGALDYGYAMLIQRVGASDTIAADSETVYIDSTAARTMSATHAISISAVHGQRLTIHNMGAFTITLPEGAGFTSAAGFDVKLQAGAFATFHYRADTALWYLQSNNGWEQLNNLSLSSQGLGVFGATTDAQPKISLGTAFGTILGFGPGGATAVDTTVTRTAARTLRMAGAGTTNLEIHNSSSDSLASFLSTGFNFYADADDAQPVLSYATSIATLSWGAGGASAVDVTLTRSGTATLTLTGVLLWGASGSLNLNGLNAYGDDASSGNLLLNATSHATKGRVKSVDDFEFDGAIYLGRTNVDMGFGYLRYRYLEMLEEFWGTSTTSGSIGTHGWTSTLANTATVTVGTSTRYLLNTITTAGAATLTNQTMAELSVDFDWEWAIVTPVLATANTQDYELYIGWGNTTNAEPTNGYYFKYDVDTSPNWITVTTDGTAASTTTTTAVAAQTYTRLRCQRSGTTVTFYVNDVLVATHSNTHNPTILSTYAPMAAIVKEAGATSRTMSVDAHHFVIKSAR